MVGSQTSSCQIMLCTISESIFNVFSAMHIHNVSRNPSILLKIQARRPNILSNEKTIVFENCILKPGEKCTLSLKYSSRFKVE